MVARMSKLVAEKPSYHLYWFAFLIMTFLVSLGASWVLLARANFAYPLLHDYAGIKENIEYYSHRSRIKPDFNQTTREERIQLFKGILESIQHQGQGLEALAYHIKNGQEIILLTAAEVVHLQDVANLYDRIKKLVLIAFVILLGLLVMQFKWYRALPQTSMLIRYALVLPVIIGIVLVVGAEKVFYKLHELVFPAGHQWFFYYEESLMSMMMKAPDLFAYIAVMLVVLALVFTVGLLWLYRKLLF